MMTAPMKTYNEPRASSAILCKSSSAGAGGRLVSVLIEGGQRSHFEPLGERDERPMLMRLLRWIEANR